MFVNKLSQSNATNFSGYENVKYKNGKLISAKKGMPGSISLFIAGGKKVDEKVALANRKIMQNQQLETKESKQNSVLLFFASMLSIFGLNKPLNNLLGK